MDVPEYYVDGAGEHRWRLKSRNGRVVATSGEGYTRKAGAQKGWAALAKIVIGAILVEVATAKTSRQKEAA